MRAAHAIAALCALLSTLFGTPVQQRSSYVVLWMPFGDSTTYGVGATNTAAYRSGLYSAAQSAGSPFYFTGSQSNGGTLLTADPWNEGVPGITAASLNGDLIRIPVYGADVVSYLGGTNDIAAGATAAATAASISSGVDTIWSYRTGSNFQIVLFTIIKRLDGFDPTVQAANALLPAIVAGKSFASHITLIDIYGAIQNPTVGGGYNDVVHPNDTGYNDIAAYAWSHGASAAVAACRAIQP